MSEGALLNTLKLFFGKMKSECEFVRDLLCNDLFVTTSVYYFGKNHELVKNLFFMDVEKK